MTAFIEPIVPLVLAGGRGTRISGLFPDLPKPAIPVAGKPFLAWILAQLSRVGFCQVVISGGYLFQVLKDEILPHVPFGMEAVWVDEKTPRGTGGAAIHAARESNLHPRQWLVMNGDSYLGGDWPTLVATKCPAACLLARRVEESGRFGKLEVSGGRLVSLKEKSGGGPGLINAGIYLLPANWLNREVSESTQSMETDLVPHWLAAGNQIQVLEVQGPFLDIGIPEDYLKADEFFFAQVGAL